nr:MAG TPA: hypothetical protein [Caudoviricetes sp.]
MCSSQAPCSSSNLACNIYNLVHDSRLTCV